MNYWDMELTELGKTYNTYIGRVSANSMQLHGRAMPELGAEAEEQWGELCGQCAQLAEEATQEEQVGRRARGVGGNGGGMCVCVSMLQSALPVFTPPSLPLVWHSSCCNCLAAAATARIVGP